MLTKEVFSKEWIKKTSPKRGFSMMARSGGFEPPTAWFVARYSIQLSYERVGLSIDWLRLVIAQVIAYLNMARPGGFEPPTAWFVARYSIQLS